MEHACPTIKSPAWSCRDFLDSVIKEFKTTNERSEVRMYFYGATRSGWNEIRQHARNWIKAKKGRTISAYIGTDHALTEPEALSAMSADGVSVHLLTCYSGVFHPKLIVFSGARNHTLLSGSNNLTLSGLSSNIEFATIVEIEATSEHFANWESAIQKSSDPLSETLLKDYTRQRNQRQKKLQEIDLPWQFTWRKRKKSSIRLGAAIQPALPIEIQAGCLLYEVMPKETGLMGSQIQILKDVAIKYFKLPNKVGSSVEIILKSIVTGEERQLTMTYNRNTTMRLSIHEASYTERPCFLIFRHVSLNLFEFAVVSEALDPTHFQLLDEKLGEKRPRIRRAMII